MKKVLVTGGAGFVGRHLCKALLERGDHVICVDSIVPLTGGIDPSISSGWPLYNPFDFKNFDFIKMDCRDYFKINEDDDFDEVYHLAAMVGGREMIENNPLAVAEDLAIDSLFWKWAKSVKPGKIACFSSSAAYPIKFQRSEGYRLLDETDISFSDDIGFPDLSYGWAKLTHEYLARLAFERHGLKSITYRPFSGYGEDQDIAYPFPSICRRVLQNKNAAELVVWGSGDQMRDFIHIEDCVSGILGMFDKIDDGSAVNLSTGKLTSFKEFAAIAANIVGYRPNVIGTANTPEGVFARGGEVTLQRTLGFNHILSFEAGIVRGLEYQEKVLSNG